MLLNRTRISSMIRPQWNVSIRLLIPSSRSTALQLAQSWALFTRYTIAFHTLRIVLFSTVVKVALRLMVEAVIDEFLMLVREVDLRIELLARRCL